MSSGKYSTDIKEILNNKNNWDYSLENVIERIEQNEGSVSIKAQGTDKNGVTCNIRNKIVGKELGAKPIIGDTEGRKNYNDCDASEEGMMFNRSLICSKSCLSGAQWSEAGELAQEDYVKKRRAMASDFGKFINETKINTISKMDKIEKYLQGDPEKPENFGGISKNTFTPTYIPCLIQSDYTNQTMPDLDNLPFRYNYNIVESNANDGMFKNLENNTNSSNEFKKITYNYEKYYEIYNEILLVNPENIDSAIVDYESYFGNNDLLKIGSEPKKGFININDTDSVVYINGNINEHILNNGYQDWTLKTLKNLSNHRWDLFVKRKLFVEDDLNSQKKFRVLGYRNKGKIGFLIYKDSQITEVMPIGNVAINKHANAFGKFKYYVPSLQKSVDCIYLHKNAVLENLINDEFTIKQDTYYGFVNPNGGKIKFKNVSVTYNKWLNSPDKIIMKLSSISEPLFIKSYINQQIKINDKGQIANIFPYEMFSQNNLDSNLSNVTNNTENIIINIKWGKKPKVYGRNKVLKYIENKKGGIIELDDGSWFYNPGKIDLYIEFNNVLSETNSMFDINNIFDEKSKQCKKISLPTPTGCQTKPILLRDYIHIQNNHPTLFADCGNRPRLYGKIRKEILDNFVFMDSDNNDVIDINEYDAAIETYRGDMSEKEKTKSRKEFFNMDKDNNGVSKNEVNSYFDDLEKEGFANENLNFIKDVNVMMHKNREKNKTIQSLFFLSSGLLLLYILFRLRNK